jgi:hypothetical protein
VFHDHCFLSVGAYQVQVHHQLARHQVIARQIQAEVVAVCYVVQCMLVLSCMFFLANTEVFLLICQGT